MTKRDFLQITDFSTDELKTMFDLAVEIKAQTRRGECPTPLAGQSWACIFHKASLRTRISFEVGLQQLGGGSLYITNKEIELGKRESIPDVARVLSRYVGGIVIRTYNHKDVEELAEWASVPVINALTDFTHPCQVISDLLTIQEHLGTFEGKTITYLGDGNNMARSWINAARRLDFSLRIGTSKDTHPGELVDIAKSEGARVEVLYDPIEAVSGTHVVYTDVWASMGEKDKLGEKTDALKAFQINNELLTHADDSAIVMHCLPAERGREITDEVMDGPRAVVFDEAENRLHAQKAIMVTLAG
ncbi:MAG TPA: ornithine carbamoyltransferase [Bacteroidetes bacterium]|nr:ornithine carbamoyltransferase [bacterium BMS3Bbin04]HDO65127.1 ornithine carbamoyltransferase [Bacteroidota bacterium]HEX04252.1 ornithine carbamoyltransferase [Bacteroidota bacterium]